MKPNSSLAPAVIPPEYLPLKLRLMKRHKDDFAALRKQNVRLRLLEIFIFIGVWISAATLTLAAPAFASGFAQIILQLIGIFFSGIALLVFFLEVHEGMHSILFKNKLLNDCISWLFCLPLLLSYTGSTILHLRHHRYLGAQEDPDEYRFYAKTRLGLWLLHYGRLFIAPTIYIFLIPVLGYRYGTSKQRLHILAECGCMLCVYTLIFTTIPFSSLLLAWILPSIFTGFLIGLWGLAQHAMTDASDPLLASRSVHANPVVSFCFINQNYHLEHHLFPEIPSYHLKRAFQITWKQLPYALVAGSYTGFMLEFIRSSFRLEDRPIGYTDLLGW